MSDLIGSAGILDAARQPVGDSQPPLDFGQQQDAAIRRQPSAVKSGDNGLAADRLQARQREGKVNFGGHGALETVDSG